MIPKIHGVKIKGILGAKGSYSLSLFLSLSLSLSLCRQIIFPYLTKP